MLIPRAFYQGILLMVCACLLLGRCWADNNRIQVFRLDGTFVRQWASEGSAAGQFANPIGVCVSAAGEVLVADCDNHRIQVFRLGTFVRQWGNSGSWPMAVCVYLLLGRCWWPTTATTAFNFLNKSLFRICLARRLTQCYLGVVSW